MKKTLSLFLAVGLAIVLSAGISGAVTIYDIQNSDLSGKGVGSYVIGDKIFSDFTITNINPNAVTITGFQIDSTVYIDFNGLFQTSSTTGVDYSLTYIVTSMGPAIASIDQGFNLTNQGNGGNVAIGETVFDQIVFPRTQVAQSSIGYVFGVGDPGDPPGEVTQGDQLYINPALQSVYVTKDISVTANAGGLVGATIIEQSFHQTEVPEPATMLLLGSGLIGLAGFARRKFKK